MLYDYQCPACGEKAEEFFHTYAQADEAEVVCPVCETPMGRLLSTGFRFQFAAGHFFEPYVDTNIHPEGEPIKIETQQQFFKECEKHGRGFRKIRDKMR